MLIKIHPENPSERNILRIVDILDKGGVIIFPTDTLYAIGCDIFKPKAVERVAQIKKIKLKDALFSIICRDLSHISDYTCQIDNPVFKLMKRNIPGPFTFILPANNKVPKLFQGKRKTVGIRVPSNNIPLSIVYHLNHPIMTTSLPLENGKTEYITDPEYIYEKYGKMVDAVIDGGFGNITPSTVVDCTESPYKILRQGLGILTE
jgi:tRNA threonylcarbamoyl adenosine modification protein (Sua5/YciO/YrdC/YwlC family)